MKRALSLLIILIFAAAAAWGGYWYWGASKLRTGFKEWFTARQTDGWQAQYADFTLQGFPNRFDSTWTGLKLGDPDTGWAVEMPLFQILMLSYQPQHVIAVADHSFLLDTPVDSYVVTNEDLRASLITDASPTLELQRATVIGKGMDIARGSRSDPLHADELRLGVERVAEPTTYHLGLAATALTPPEGWRNRISEGLALPDALSDVRMDMTASFNRPWNIHALDDSRPQPRRLELKTARAQWGEMAIEATGTVDVDDEGTPEGEVSVKAEHWREMLQMAVSSDALNADVANAIEQGLTLLAGFSGNRNSLNVTLTFTGGMMRLGPIPIGPAPRLILR